MAAAGALMGETWLTSDPHLGHRLMAARRGFGGDVGAHDAAVVAALRAAVGPDDHLWVLGDLTMRLPEYACERFRAVPGHLHLVLGNHDAGHPMHRGAHNLQRRYLGVFESVAMAATLRWEGGPVLLSHFPYRADRGPGPARFPQWRLPDLGGLLLHGHTHLPARRTSDHEVHVGLDAWGLAPVRLADAVAALKDG